MKVRIRKIHNDAKVPTYGTTGAACADLYVVEDYYLRPGDVRLLHTGFAMEIPEGYEALVRPRGSAIKNQILILNTPGTVDYDYRGEILVGVKNIGYKDFVIKKGERVAQMTVKKFERIEFEEVEELSDTERGSNGFGSTGK